MKQPLVDILLCRVFAKLDSLPEEHTVFMHPGVALLDSACCVMDATWEVPDVARQAGLEETLTVAELCGIRQNARQQGRQPTDDELLLAFRYYLDNDAFMEFA